MRYCRKLLGLEYKHLCCCDRSKKSSGAGFPVAARHFMDLATDERPFQCINIVTNVLTKKGILITVTAEKGAEKGTSWQAATLSDRVMS